MAETGSPRRGSIVGPVILIGLGVLFLMATLLPDFDLWPILARYWPLILIFIGLGQIFDYFINRDRADGARHGFSGTGIALLVLLILFVAAVWHGGPRRYDDGGWGWHGRYHWNDRGWGAGMRGLHDTQAVELQGAKSVNANLEMGAGGLTLSGGSSKLLDADFRYDESYGKPSVEYHVNGDRGTLDVTQQEEHPTFGSRDNDWDLRFGATAPIDLKLNMGAGQGDLRLNGLNVSGLEIHMGAGELHLDFNGVRTNTLEADIQGGVGSATIRLPKEIGARVSASGGLGSINAHGLKRDGDDYVNDAYGKAASTINLRVQGGVGQITLIGED
jgi:hypothetical protein